MNITNIKNTLASKFSGASLDDIGGIQDYTLFEEAAKNLIAEIDPFETVRHGELNLFDEIYDYGLSSAAPDLKGKKVIDIRPQGERDSGEDFRQTFTEDFDRDKELQDNWFSVEYDEGTKFLRVDKRISNAITVSDLDDANYTATSNISNIAEDTILYHDSGKSLRFDVALGTSLLTWNGAVTVDLSDHTNKSSFFLWVYWPDSSLVTSLTLRVGSSAANYYEMTGQIHVGSIRSGWNLYRFDWNGVADAGTTDESATDYVRLAFVTTSADTDIRIGALESKLPSPHELVYYSKALFRPLAGSTWLTLPSADTDILNLDSDAENIFINECCYLVASNLQNNEEIEKYNRILFGQGERGNRSSGGLYGNYRADKPSETIRPSSRYYTYHRRK